MKIRDIMCAVAIAGMMLGACASTEKKNEMTTETKPAVAKVEFDGDSAYSFVAAQCEFGARVPNTDAHRKCGDYLVAKLQGYGANVIVQEPVLTAYDGTKLHARNIIGEFAPEASRRVLLLAHWDCRPWADSDPDKNNHRKPVMGANDGASGVGVLLEIARLMQQKMPNVGVDILFVDAEDWGDDSGTTSDSSRTWALGTQYWAANPHREGYSALFGILLDMVGAKGSVFSREYFSMQCAPALVNELWKEAQKSGYGRYFVNREGGAITDDHVFVNMAGIPCVDIIAMDKTTTTGFFPQWHTADDTMEHIDADVLKAVGQTVANYLYSF